MTEGALYRSVKTWLDAEEREGRLVWTKYHGGPMSRAGWPDLSVYLPAGRCVLIELKGDGGVEEPLQKHTRQKLTRLNHAACVCRSLEEVRRAVDLVRCEGCLETNHEGLPIVRRSVGEGAVQ